jgi:Carbon-nitrogen hydrolase
VRIGHCQLESKCGDFEGNLAKVVKGLEQAQRERVEVVRFPECFLTPLPVTVASLPLILSLSRNDRFKDGHSGRGSLLSLVGDLAATRGSSSSQRRL